MIKKGILTISLLVIANLTFAQETGYAKGFIITNVGDTIHGLIKRFNAVPARILPDIRFKKDENSDDEKFAPDEIAAYQRDGKLYVSRVDPEGISSGSKAFMEVLIDGYLRFYEFRVTGFGAGVEMVYQYLQRRGEEQLLSVSGLDAFAEGTTFKKKLLEYLADEPAVCEKIREGEYSTGRIDKIVVAYNLLKFRVEDSKGKGPTGTIMFYVRGTKKESELKLILNDREERPVVANKVIVLKIPTDAQTKICFGNKSEKVCGLFAAAPFYPMPAYYELLITGGKQRFDIDKRFTREAQKDIAEMKGK